MSAVLNGAAEALKQRARARLAEEFDDHFEARAPRLLNLSALAPQAAPPRVWVRQDWLPNGMTLVSGAGGTGKSTLAQHEVTAAALGRAYFAPACEPVKSLLWNCEDEHDEIWRRQEAICESEDVPLDSVAGAAFLVSRYGCENALMATVQGQLVRTSLMEELREQVNDLEVQCLWLDNAAHVFLGNHDNRTEVTQFINALSSLVKGRPFSVVIVAHPGRAQGSEFSGSVAWENAVRMRWYLGSKLPDQRAGEPDNELPSTSVRFLAKRKSNYSARDYVRMEMRNGLLIPDQDVDTRVSGIAGALDERRADETCIAGFKALAAMGIRTTDGKSSPDYLPSQMVAKTLNTGYTKYELGRAMNRLMGRGRFIRAEVGKHGNRSPKFGLVLQEEQ